MFESAALVTLLRCQKTFFRFLSILRQGVYFFYEQKKEGKRTGNNVGTLSIGSLKTSIASVMVPTAIGYHLDGGSMVRKEMSTAVLLLHH